MPRGKWLSLPPKPVNHWLLPECSWRLILLTRMKQGKSEERKDDNKLNPCHLFKLYYSIVNFYNRSHFLSPLCSLSKSIFFFIVWGLYYEPKVWMVGKTVLELGSIVFSRGQLEYRLHFGLTHYPVSFILVQFFKIIYI